MRPITPIKVRSLNCRVLAPTIRVGKDEGGPKAEGTPPNRRERRPRRPPRLRLMFAVPGRSLTDHITVVMIARQALTNVILGRRDV